MTVLFDGFSTPIAIVFFVYLLFLAFGVNLLPAWASSRTSLAAVGAVIVLGGGMV